jgi:hypothetical protein
VKADDVQASTNMFGTSAAAYQDADQDMCGRGKGEYEFTYGSTTSSSSPKKKVHAAACWPARNWSVVTVHRQVLVGQHNGEQYYHGRGGADTVAEVRQFNVERDGVPSDSESPGNPDTAPGVLSINITSFGQSNRSNHELVCKLMKFGLPNIALEQHTGAAGGPAEEELLRGLGLQANSSGVSGTGARGDGEYCQKLLRQFSFFIELQHFLHAAVNRANRYAFCPYSHTPCTHTPRTHTCTHTHVH